MGGTISRQDQTGKKRTSEVEDKIKEILNADNLKKK
jgi:hypothetical protein